MGNLAIEQVVYWGEKYHYSSPVFVKGVQIVEGSNGSGKTTFSSLICYGLGLYVKQFDMNNSVEIHKEIENDSNNYVILKIIINDEKYELTRYFSKKNSNTIFVKGQSNFEDNFPINRTGEAQIFSDWLLEKLDIKVIDFYQGIRSFKINFSDLFRLIHYDQATPPSKIFKEHRNDGNFFSDSTNLKKAIFELLVGHHFSNYYAMIGDFKKAEREKEAQKRTVDSYLEMMKSMGFSEKDSYGNIQKSLPELKSQLQKLEIYGKSLKEKVYSSVQFNIEMNTERRKLFDIENDFAEQIKKRNNVSIELKDLLELREDIILEVTQIRKIILSHQELNLFSPNTCPVCLKEVKREENHCICGNHIDETQYEKFFYNADEYLDILKSKQKSVDTINYAIESCEDEIREIEHNITVLSLEREKTQKHLRLLEESVGLNSPNGEISEVNDKILEVRKEIQNLEHKLSIYIKYNELYSDYKSSVRFFHQIQAQLIRLEKTVKAEIDNRVNEFNEYYTSFLKEADSEVINAELDEDYMPIINNGEYRHASSNVIKRIVYYLTLLKLSVVKNNIPFPKFLLIDTPENLGIDKENLIKCLSLIKDIMKFSNNFQIILTTGLKKYPEEFTELVRETLTEDDKLLKVVEK